MTMPCDYTKYPPNWKSEIRPAILARAKNRCEKCGVPNYCVRRFGIDGEEERSAGNAFLDHIGENGARSYAEAREMADFWNDEHPDGEGDWTVVVLTIAHLDDPDPMNCDPANLAALCQRCHNRLDAKARAARRKKNENQLTLEL